MESEYEAKISKLTEEYRKSLLKVNLRKLGEFDFDQYITISVVVISSDVQHYTSTNISGSGGGGRIRQGVGGTTGRMSDINISSEVEHHVKNEAWVVSLENDGEFKTEFPSGFDVREGHTVVMLGFYAAEDKEDFVVERYVNLATNQMCVEAEGIFNTSTVHQTKKSSCLFLLICLIPCIGSVFSLLNLRHQNAKIYYYLKQYRGTFNKKASNYLLVLLVLPVAIYQIIQYPGLMLNPLMIIVGAKCFGAITAMLTPVVVLLLTLAMKRRRKSLIKGYIALHSEYIDTAFEVYAEEIKEDSYTLEKANELSLKSVSSIK